jgi:hypothetical protein
VVEIIPYSLLQAVTESHYPAVRPLSPGISKSFFRERVKSDFSAPVIVGRGLIACNTLELQEWWDGKRHHK